MAALVHTGSGHPRRDAERPSLQLSVLDSFLVHRFGARYESSQNEDLTMAKMTDNGLAAFVADRAHPHATDSVLLFAPHAGHRRGPRIETHAAYYGSASSWFACLISALSASGITAFLLTNATIPG
jgi:hypothetical protein